MRAQQSRVRKRTGHRTFSGDRVHTYICPNCRLFHIGHRG